MRVYERFATLDAVSRGRAEVILGRGSFIESFPLFGYDLRDYEVLFDEKLDLFSQLLTEKPVTWQGTMRAPLSEADVFPKTENGLKAWVGVGGTPESVVRAARYGYGLMLAIIGGPAERFRPFVDLYHRSLDSFGRDPLPVGVHSPGHIAETDQQAWDEAYEGFESMNNTIGASAAGRRTAACGSSTTSGPRARCTSARPRPSRARSPTPCGRSAPADST